MEKKGGAKKLEEEDENLWLEDVTGEDAINWVKAQNEKLKYDARSSDIYKRLLEAYDSKDKIPYVTKRGKDQYYNFWKDEKNERGLLRRTTLEEYKKSNTTWEVVFDLDDYNRKDKNGENKWVYKGSVPLDEGPGVDVRRVLMKLSRGGKDAVECREFDYQTCDFVKEEEAPFNIPEAKSRISWKDPDTLLVGTDFGENSMTDSGYPRIIKELKRGTKLEDATTVFEGEKTDVAVSASYYRDGSFFYEKYTRAITFYTSEFYFKVNGELVKIQIPEDAEVNTHEDQLLVRLKTTWGDYKAGSFLAVPFDVMLQKQETLISPENKTNITVLFDPTSKQSLEYSISTKNFLILLVLDDVKSAVLFWRYDLDGQKWTQEFTRQDALDRIQSLDISSVDPDSNDLFWIISSSFDLPTTLSLSDASGAQPTEEIKQLPHFFDATNLKIEQRKAKSLDGTEVNYFQVFKETNELKNLPTLLYGYGGFEVSITPSYSATVGISWLERGFVYCVANIRGGGEYGPSWHQAALKKNRNKAFEDFEAVARDLIRRKVTTPKTLGCYGGSNGGLLVGNMLVRSSDLFGAILCRVPLLDMKRYSHLLAGASWMAEYGNPDIPEEWESLKKYSPYHNLDKKKSYAPIMFTTSTKDDRVHPGHARKMARRMIDLGFGDKVFYYENIEGGHGGASTNEQTAYMQALGYLFLEDHLNSAR